MTAKKKIKPQYFLFGEAVCRELEEEGIKEAVKVGKENGCAIYMWNENSSPVELLSGFDGWNAWLKITKKQYDAFNKI
jgi:hypothetical protein